MKEAVIDKERCKVGDPEKLKKLFDTVLTVKAAEKDAAPPITLQSQLCKRETTPMAMRGFDFSPQMAQEEFTNFTAPWGANNMNQMMDRSERLDEVKKCAVRMTSNIDKMQAKSKKGGFLGGLFKGGGERSSGNMIMMKSKGIEERKPRRGESMKSEAMD